MSQKKSVLSDILTADVCFLFAAFDNRLRLVGGCVRDFLLGQKPHDVDFATPLKPDEIVAVLKKAGISYYETGIKHGTVTAVLNHTPYEITSLRCDCRTDGRHAAVRFGVDYETDAKRRDFTMNALYMNEKGDIFDYAGGRCDLAEKKIRFIGQAQKRIQEDYLRILRYFRFIARFGGNYVEQEALHACRALRSGLQQISVERIREEFMRILSGKYVSDALRLMDECLLLDLLLPQKNVDDLERFLSLYPEADPLERLAVLTHSTPPLHWKWSRAQKNYLMACCKKETISPCLKNARYLLWRLGRKLFLFHLAKRRLYKPMPMKTYYCLKRLKSPFFPVAGKDFFALGYRGKDIQKMMKRAEKKWVEMNFLRKKTLVIHAVLLYNKK